MRMLLNPKTGFLFALFILICAPAARLGQVQEMSPLTSAVAAAITIEEPEWNYIPGHCTCPPLSAGQISHDLGIWERKVGNGDREQLVMDIYKIQSAKEVVDFMKAYDGETYKGPCRVQKHQLGDEAYLLDCSANNGDNKKMLGGPITLWLRKKNFLMSVNGYSQDTVLRFAGYGLRELESDQ